MTWFMYCQSVSYFHLEIVNHVRVVLFLGHVMSARSEVIVKVVVGGQWQHGTRCAMLCSTCVTAGNVGYMVLKH